MSDNCKHCPKVKKIVPYPHKEYLEKLNKCEKCGKSIAPANPKRITVLGMIITIIILLVWIIAAHFVRVYVNFALVKNIWYIVLGLVLLLIRNSLMILLIEKSVWNSVDESCDNDPANDSFERW
ncbi:MAG: DUF983 domain-containing protein [Clostridia bacterium]|nr:DUF983 domain-containing protein [Clostridia bacterium]